MDEEGGDEEVPLVVVLVLEDDGGSTFEEDSSVDFDLGEVSAGDDTFDVFDFVGDFDLSFLSLITSLIGGASLLSILGASNVDIRAVGVGFDGVVA